MDNRFRTYILIILLIIIVFGLATIGTNILNDSDEQDVVEAYNKEAVHLPVSIQELIKIIEVKRAEVPEDAMKIIEDSVSENESEEETEEPDPNETEPVNDTKLYVWKELRKAGFSEAAAAGIMGNIEEEHHFQTSDVKGGLGICQWIGGRRTNCINHCNKNGLDYLSIQGQTSYMIEELTGSNKPVGSYLSNRSPATANATYRDTIKHGYELLGESYKEPHEYGSLEEFKQTGSVDDACLSTMGRFERCNSGYRTKDHLWYARSNERLHSARVLYSTYKGTEI